MWIACASRPVDALVWRWGNPVKLAVEDVGFEPHEIKSATLRIEDGHVMLDVDVVDTVWEPTFEFTIQELREKMQLARVGELMVGSAYQMREAAMAFRKTIDAMNGLRLSWSHYEQLAHN
jgi:hypothetical protein